MIEYAEDFGPMWTCSSGFSGEETVRWHLQDEGLTLHRCGDGDGVTITSGEVRLTLTHGQVSLLSPRLSRFAATGHVMSCKERTESSKPQPWRVCPWTMIAGEVMFAATLEDGSAHLLLTEPAVGASWAHHLETIGFPDTEGAVVLRTDMHCVFVEIKEDTEAARGSWWVWGSPEALEELRLSHEDVRRLRVFERGVV